MKSLLSIDCGVSRKERRESKNADVKKVTLKMIPHSNGIANEVV